MYIAGGDVSSFIMAEVAYTVLRMRKFCIFAAYKCMRSASALLVVRQRATDLLWKKLREIEVN